MKVLVFGPSGSGKTYISHALQQQGLNALDADELPGLSAWYNRDGKKVPEPATAEEATKQQLAFLWSRKALAAFLAQYEDVYLFGGAGNIAQVFPLFDLVLFLHITPELQQERLRSPGRPTPHLDQQDGSPVIWGDWFEELARQQQLPFIDASLPPSAIWEAIQSLILTVSGYDKNH